MLDWLIRFQMEFWSFSLPKIHSFHVQYEEQSGMTKNSPKEKIINKLRSLFT